MSSKIAPGIMPDKCPQPTFERFADTTLDKVRATYAQRGQEYADSWDLSQYASPFTDLALTEINKHEYLGDLSPEAKRLIANSSMLDVKLSRLGGGYKEDTLIDMIAYLAFFTQALSEYVASRPF